MSYPFWKQHFLEEITKKSWIGQLPEEVNNEAEKLYMNWVIRAIVEKVKIWWEYVFAFKMFERDYDIAKKIEWAKVLDSEKSNWESDLWKNDKKSKSKSKSKSKNKYNSDKTLNKSEVEKIGKYLEHIRKNPNDTVVFPWEELHYEENKSPGWLNLYDKLCIMVDMVESGEGEFNNDLWSQVINDLSISKNDEYYKKAKIHVEKISISDELYDKMNEVITLKDLNA